MKKNKTQKRIAKTPTSPMVSGVLKRIESESITPKAWWRFACVNCMVWIAWAVTVFFGAISVAVLLYVSNRSRFELFEATHDTFFSFLLEVLPFVWVFTFAVMVIFAYFNMRHTKCGYRYSLWKMLVSSVFLSVLLGAVLHVLGLGFIIDTQLAKNMPTYISLENMELGLWQKPIQGRLVGVLQEMTDDGGEYILVDSTSSQWIISTDELREIDIALLRSGAKVRLLGTTTDFANKTFYACGVFPWVFDRNTNIAELLSTRKMFVRRMHQHFRRGVDLKRQKKSSKTEGVFILSEEGLCANIMPVRRMKN